MLRRTAEPHRRSRLRRGARAARGAAPRRRARWPSGTSAGKSSSLVPADQVERLLAAVIEEARAWTGRLVELPAGEGVALEIVRDEPWLAFCSYLGGAPQPGRRQRRSAVVCHRPARPRDPRDVSRPPHGASLQGAPARSRTRTARGDAGAGAHAAVARLGGDRRARAGGAARERRRAGARRGHARRRHRARSRSRVRRRAGPRAVPVGRGQRGVDAARRGSERGRDAGVSRALGR